MYFTNTVGTVMLSKHTNFFYNTKQNNWEDSYAFMCWIYLRRTLQLPLL